MKRLFLSSLFKNVTKPFTEFVAESLMGKVITYIPTAANCEKLDFHVRYSRKVLSKMGLIVDELDISTAPYTDIANKLQNNDYIYVGGGNTFFLLQEMQKTGAGDIIKQQIEQGKLYVGESAGAIVVAPDIEYSSDMDKPQAAPDLPGYNGLNVIDFYPLPHVRDFTQRKAVKSITAKYEAKIPLVPITNSQVILVTGIEKQIVG